MKVSSKGNDVKDLQLATQGQDLIEWAAREMPVRSLISNWKADIAELPEEDKTLDEATPERCRPARLYTGGRLRPPPRAQSYRAAV